MDYSYEITCQSGTSGKEYDVVRHLLLATLRHFKKQYIDFNKLCDVRKIFSTINQSFQLCTV